MDSKLFLRYKKYIAILLMVLSLTQTINHLAYANTFLVSDSVSIGFVKDGKILRSYKSGNCSVAFGKSGQIIKSNRSRFLSVGINNPNPILIESGVPLVNISPTIGVAPQVVAFSAEDVALRNEHDLTYLWNFDDSNQSTGATATHTYTTPGIYPVTLTVTNQSGKSSTYTKEIEIRDKNEPPLADVVVSVFETDDYKEVTFDASIKENVRRGKSKFDL